MLESFHFLRPWWLLAVPVGLYIGWRWLRQQGADSAWRQAIDPALLNVLLDARQPQGRRALSGFAAVALVFAALGLAGPTYQRLPQPVEQTNDALLILLDLSLSMYARDLEPSRLVRARQKISDILRHRDEGFTALVAYAGDAHTVAPFTDDTATIDNLLSALSPRMMPVLGSTPRSAMEKAEKLFTNSGLLQGRILLITDGVDQMSQVTEYRNPNFPVSILGVGTPEGAPIPLDEVGQPGRTLQTQQGETILARLAEDPLREVAEAAYGRYHRLTLTDQDLRAVLDVPLPSEDDTIAADRTFDLWDDLGWIGALLALPAVLLGFRRGALMVVVLCLLPHPAFAGWWDDLWQRRDQQALEAFRQGDPEQAAILFEDPRWRAAAAYRSGDYPAAAELYGSRSETDAQFNLGNTLARAGRYRQALDAYDRVLAQQPDHEDARFNRALVEKLLQAQQQANEQDQQEQQQRGGEQPESEREQQQSANDQSQDQSSEPADAQADAEAEQDENRDSATEPAEGEPQPAEAELAESRDEKQEALEQWLRRVPDDPGGLLRRKFQYETNQRLRSGDYRYREQEKIW